MSYNTHKYTSHIISPKKQIHEFQHLQYIQKRTKKKTRTLSKIKLRNSVTAKVGTIKEISHKHQLTL